MKHLLCKWRSARQIWKFTCNSIRSSANRFWSYAAPIFDAPGSRPGAAERVGHLHHAGRDGKTRLQRWRTRRIADFALQQRCVRGVTFQPVQVAGRVENFDPARDRLTLTEVRRKILEQTSVFRPEDLIPVPCHPDCLAMAYALKLGGKVTPLTGLIDPKVLIEGGRNTIVYEQDDAVRKGIFRLFATNHSPASGATSLRDLLCCLPRLPLQTRLDMKMSFGC